MRYPICCILFLLSLSIICISANTSASEGHEDSHRTSTGHGPNESDTNPSGLIGHHANKEHHGLTRNLGLANFFEDWTTPWEPYVHNEEVAPRVPLLRIVPGFFSREVRANYIHINDEHHGEANVNELSFALELPLTLRIKLDIEAKVLHLDPSAHHGESHGDASVVSHLNKAASGSGASGGSSSTPPDILGFGDTKLALRSMLLENKTLSLSTGTTFFVPTGDKKRGLGKGIATVGQELALWLDLGNRISLHSLVGVEVPIGGEHKEDSNVDLIYGLACSKTFTVHDIPVMEGITPFLELNGRKKYGLEEGEDNKADLLFGLRWDLPHELFILNGFEVPLNGTEDFDNRFWFGFIKDF